MGEGGSVGDLGVEGVGGAVLVGQGGFGVVYRARQEAFGRAVAVKILAAPMLVGETGRRFEQECRALGSLSGHPHIVALYGSGTTASGQPYLLMDYLPGGTLAQRLGSDGPRPWVEVADVGVKLAGALATAHAAGVLHRDLKPENVLISAYGEPQLVDFGVARIQGGTTTRSGVITGSLAHAAPEVLSGRPATEASDVYSLASTLYALLAGQAPFVRPGDETFHPMITRIVTEEPPDLRANGVPPALWDALTAALAKDPADRTRSALALAEALRAAQRSTGGEPTPLVVRSVDDLPATPATPDNLTMHRARREPPPPAAPIPPPWHRRPWAITLAALAAVLLAATGAFALTQRKTPKSRQARSAPSTAPTTSVTSSPPAPTATSLPPTNTASSLASAPPRSTPVPPPTTTTPPASTTAPPPSTTAPDRRPDTAPPPASTNGGGTTGANGPGSATVAGVFSGGGAPLYAITNDGKLLWYRHTDPQGGKPTWAPGARTTIGNGWAAFRSVFSGGGGVIYAITNDGKLLWYRHTDPQGGKATWAPGARTTIGNGWAAFRSVFSGGGGVIYAITNDGKLLWYRHTDPQGGKATWAPGARTTIGPSGW
jgi:serine/threonine protein kinase